MEKINLNHQHVMPVVGKPSPHLHHPQPAQGANDFRNVFDSLINVQFSKHANTRLIDRNINLSNEQLTRLEQSIDDAKAKGIKDSLVLLDNIAMVVNVPSRTVITALNPAEQEQQKNIFTNIDGAVIA